MTGVQTCALPISSWDLSKYHYLIVELGEGSEYAKNGWQFRIYDLEYGVDDQIEIFLNEDNNVTDNRIVMDLTKEWKTRKSNRVLDWTKVNIIGFWSYGEPFPIYIEKVYATNEAN